MPDNVREAFVEDVFNKVGQMPIDAAKELLKNLERNCRLQVETW